MLILKFISVLPPPHPIFIPFPKFNDPAEYMNRVAAWIRVRVRARLCTLLHNGEVLHYFLREKILDTITFCALFLGPNLIPWPKPYSLNLVPGPNLISWP